MAYRITVIAHNSNTRLELPMCRKYRTLILHLFKYGIKLKHKTSQFTILKLLSLTAHSHDTCSCTKHLHVHVCVQLPVLTH